VTEWGPGPAVEAAFEARSAAATCGSSAAGDGAALLARLRLEGARTEADVVLGLDTNLTAAATATGLFAPHGIETPTGSTCPSAWDDPVFLPFDWGWFAFVHDTTAARTAGELPRPRRQRRLDPDPGPPLLDARARASPLGQGAYGDEAPAIWEGLSDNIVTVTQGWSEAYGLFLEGEADMVLSYTTSPAYHLIAEDDPTKAAAPFAEGHYMQIEVAGALASSDQPELARAFLAFMLTDAFQSVIPTTNWMYPAVTPEAGLPEGFDTLHARDRPALPGRARPRPRGTRRWPNGSPRSR
jgi:thiamine transport system substrate-binding protein